ncbi:MAG: response regulator [Bacteroidales bacterium]|nr:response regulator [Bacteroidales bacterium]MCF8336759.1 response regulator [Bacteroidales bacterium]
MKNSSNRDPHIKIFNFKLTPHIGVGKSLFLWFLFISIVPLLTVSYINYFNAYKSLAIATEKTLVNSSRLKVDKVNSYFTGIEKDLNFQSKLQSNKIFLKQLSEGYSNASIGLRDYLETAKYQNIIEQRNNYFKKIRASNNYYDIYLIDEKGNVLYSAKNEHLLGTNVFDGEYSNTKIGETAQNILETGQMLFSDFERDIKNMELVSGIIGKPFREDGDVIGMIAFRIQDNDLNRLMQKENDIGKTGITYIVGEDLMMRSISRSLEDTILMNQKITNERTKKWLRLQLPLQSYRNNFGDKQKNMVSSYEGVKGQMVYGIARTISKLQDYGVRWAIVEEFELDEAFVYPRKLSDTVKISLIVTVIVVLIIAIFVTRRTVTPIKKLSAWAKQVAEGHLEKKDIRAPKNEVGEMKNTFNNLVDYLLGLSYVTQDIAKGDFSSKVEVRSEHDVLAKSVNQMIESFRTVVNQANKISQGDYTEDVKPRSEKDTLGIALENMTRTLRESSKEIRRQDWLKTGISQLNARMSGKKDLSQLSKEIIEFMAEYLNAKLGLIYIKEEDKLVLQESYALKEEDQFKEIKIGEGLVGQAVQSNQIMEMQHTSMEEIPSIDMTVAKEKPSTFLVAPFNYEGQTIGVIQIGNQKTFTELERQLFEDSLDSIAVAANAALAHSQLQKLLKKSQEQQEKLEVQQEELRQTNEELEEQTKALKASENTLQQQKEELSVINEELEERTKALEKEKEKIKVKNDELETARKQIEEKAHDLEKASKYKSEFLANMSHELRTPLNSILVLSQLLIRNDSGNLTDKQIEFAKTINTSGNDLLELINDILDLSKVESGKLQLNIEKVDLQEIADNIERIFDPVITRKGLELHVEVDKNLPQYIHSDPQRIMQIIKNLMSNAMKFTNKGYIKLHIFKPDPQTSFSTKELNKFGAVGITISDTGSGIPKDKRELIFEAFQQADGTTSRKYGGTGLGLSITRSFTQLLRGEITLDSEEDKGTSFTLYIPEKITKESTEEHEKTSNDTGDAEKEQEAYEEDGVGDSTQQEEQTPKEANGEKEDSTVEEQTEVRETGEEGDQEKGEAEEAEEQTSESDAEEKDIEIPEDDRNRIKEDEDFILVIEGDTEFAKTVYKKAIEKEYKTMIAQDGATGIHYADYYGPAAIILDEELPEIDGWDVMNRLKSNSRTRHIPVYFISATDKSMEAMNMGGLGSVTKPVSSEALEEVFKKFEDVLYRKEKKVLVVDDESVVRKSVEGVIGKEGVQIKSVGKGQEAFELLKDELFDLVILDLGLEDMSGFDLLEMIKKEESITDVPIIIYTSQNLDEEEQKAMKKYAESVIIKGAHSPERLLAEATLFLHKSQEELPDDKKKILHKLIDDKGDLLKDKKVLAVDDDVRNLFALSSVLNSYGMQVNMAKNGMDAVEKLKEEHDYDVVLMDIMMPEMDGYEAIRKIREIPEYETLPIIALTAKAMKNDREKCLAAGASEYLAKPVDNEKLLSMLRVWLYNKEENDQ